MERILPEITKRGILISGLSPQPEIQKHQETADWPFKEEATKWYGVSQEMYKRFFNGLVYPDGKVVPAPVIAFDDLRNKNTLACYDLYPDEYGILGKITFNTEWYEKTDGKQRWTQGDYALGETLLHECCHLNQQIGRGLDPYNYKKYKRNTHNKEFITMAEKFGIHPMPNVGCHTQIATPGSPINILLKDMGIFPPKDAYGKPADDRMNWGEWIIGGGKESKTGRSSLTKWECECVPPQRARVGKSEFFAVCPKCRESFTKK